MDLFALFKIGNFAFGVVDIVVIVILLLGILVGAKVGFIRKFLKAIKGIVGLVAGYFLCKPVSKVFSKNVEPKVSDKLWQFLQTKGEAFTTTLPSDPTYRRQALEQGVSEMKLPSSIGNKLIDRLMVTEEPTAGEAIAKILANLFMIILSFVIIYVLCLIIVGIISIIIKKLIGKRKALGTVDRLFGAIFGLVETAVIVCGIFLIVVPLLNSSFLSGVSDWISNDICLTESGVISISKFIYNSNPLLYLYSLIAK